MIADHRGVGLAPWEVKKEHCRTNGLGEAILSIHTLVGTSVGREVASVPKKLEGKKGEKRAGEHHVRRERSFSRWCQEESREMKRFTNLLSRYVLRKRAVWGKKRKGSRLDAWVRSSFDFSDSGKMGLSPGATFASVGGGGGMTDVETYKEGKKEEGDKSLADHSEKKQQQLIVK